MISIISSENDMSVIDIDHIKEEGEILVCDRCPKHYYGQKEMVKHMKQADLDTKQ